MDAGNYRPISILPIVSKLLEKIVHQQLYAYLNKNDYLSPVQSGFRKSFSTQTSLHRLTEYILDGLNSSEVIGMVAIDLKKAFDTVDHAILLQKLDHYGVRDTPQSWFKCYLSNRTQVSIINDTKSDLGHIRTGVPQGSILGPLLFIVYINDLPGCLSECVTNMYADDTAFYYKNRDKNRVSEALNCDIVNIYSWLCSNKLSLHVGKTNAILICNHQKVRFLNSQNLDVKLEGNEIAQTDSLCYLGIDIDNRCNFDSYTTNLIKKVNRSIGVIKRSAPYLPLDARITLYNSLILPHLDYCSTVWGCTSKSNIMRIQRLQSRAMRIILHESPRSHIEDMLAKLKWLSVSQRIDYSRLILMWKIVHGHAPSYLTENLKYSDHDYNTSSSVSENLFIPHAHKHSLYKHGAKMWNSLPCELRKIPILNSFKKKLCVHIKRHFEQF